MAGFRQVQVVLMAMALVFPGYVNGESVSVAPAHEQVRNKADQLGGPTKTSGIESSELLASLALGEDFPSLDGRVMRARVVTIAPGGEIAVHRHEARPGIAYILEGELTETRSDEGGPIVRTPGMVSVEKSGIVHWWRNNGTSSARALVVDIVPEGM